MKFIKQLYFSTLFFYSLLGLAILFVFGFFFSALMPSLYLVCGLFVLCILIDWIVIFFFTRPLKISRNYPERFSNGDENICKLIIDNRSRFSFHIQLLEEYPLQFQKREETQNQYCRTKQRYTLTKTLIPKERGEYIFGKINALISFIGLVQRRIQYENELIIPCYPSFLKLNHYSFIATSNRLHELGVKRIRKIGSSMAFDTIKQYTTGDEYRFINWKATAKARKLMVNQYQDEKSQPVYAIIDTGRAMQMPFDGLSLLDYAINSTLIFANITLQKQEKVGLIPFNTHIKKPIIADRKNHQLALIMDRLYTTNTATSETDFGHLYAFCKRKLTQRSLLFIYTNFETLDALNRQLPYLKLLKKSHVVVVILFKNTLLKQTAQTPANTVKELYTQVIAESFMYDKELIVQRLNQHGILTIYSEPKELTIESINKYLELKARGVF